MPGAMVGLDIGTSSKGVLADISGRVRAPTTRGHRVSRPRPGHVPVREIRLPGDTDASADLYPRYRELYTSTRDLTHALAALQHR